tara:strand:+ start:2086 stop:2616 length:531 start_codon:yes stop_codon:yes gene_type:complete
MAMNQTQRDHFCNRVREKCDTKINNIRAQYSAEIQSIADSKYHEFVSALGLEEDMHALKTAQQIQTETGNKVKGILDGLVDIHPTGGKGSYGGSLYASKSDMYEVYSKYLKDCCRATAEKEFLNSDAGQELKSLEETKTRAIDTIMMDGSKVEELTLKLDTILGKNGLQLLEASTV